MASPGWYPDPQAPDGKRYWDGSAWADSEPRKAQPLWLWFGIAITVIGAIVAAMILLPNSSLPLAGSPIDTRTARPSGSQWNELVPSETPTPTPIESGFGEVIDCPNSAESPYSRVENGRISSGHLSFEKPPGNWKELPSYVDWMYDYNSMIRDIAPGWISNVGVGYVRVSDGFSPNPATATEQFVTCMASSGMFQGFTHREILINEEYVVSDQIGWRLLSKVYVNDQGDIEGDEVNIVLFPTEDPDIYAAYVSCATIEHEENLAEVEAAFQTLAYNK